MRSTRRFAVLLLAMVIPALGLVTIPATAAVPAQTAARIQAAARIQTATGAVPAAGSSPKSTVMTARTAPVHQMKATGPVDYTKGCNDTRPGSFNCYSLHRTDVKPHRVSAPAVASPVGGYYPADLQSAYKLPSSTAGAGQTVYVIDAFGYPNAEADMNVYRRQFHLPVCTTANGCFKKINQNGQAAPLPAYNEGWSAETALDLDMVSATCPKCHITLVEATDNRNNLFIAVARANTLGARFISMSWGSQESGNEAGYDSAYFNRTGVVYSVSSGDFGYSAGVSYPSSSKNAVAVGGTSLFPSSSPRRWVETTWGGSNSDGTGSGCSTGEPKPLWQAVIAGSVCTNRAGNDISAVADPNTGVAVYQLGARYGDWSIAGGTSASAPIIASIYALAGTPGYYDHPASYPYANSAAVNDVDFGINGYCSPTLLCSAATGWDGPTGLGTPSTAAALKKPAQAVGVVNPDSQASPIGSPVSLRVTGTATPSTAVTFGASGLPTGLAITPATGVISGTPSALGAYPVTVRATVGAATSIAYFVWTIASPATFLPTDSTRLLDTRNGIGAPRALVAAGGSVALQVLGRGEVPSSGVAAVVLNVTVTSPGNVGYVTVYPDGTTRPTTSNLNYVKGQTVPNLVVTPVGADGKVRLYTSAGAHLIADVSGFYLGGTPAVPGSFGPLAPIRVLDTRSGFGAPSGPVASNASIAVQVLGRGGVPSSGVSAVVLNVTATGTTNSGFVTVYGDGNRPAASNLNFVRGQTVPNLVVAPVGADGKVRLFTSAATQLVADVSGYFTTSPTSAPAGGTLNSLAPARLLDTRNGTGGTTGPVPNGDIVFLQVAGAGGVKATGVSAVVLNVTVVNPGGGGYITVFSADAGQPTASNLNYVKGQTVANLVVVPVSSDGYVALSVNGSGGINLIADVSGYFNAAAS